MQDHLTGNKALTIHKRTRDFQTPSNPQKRRTRLLTRTNCLQLLFLVILVSSSADAYESRIVIRHTSGVNNASALRGKTCCRIASRVKPKYLATLSRAITLKPSRIKCSRSSAVLRGPCSSHRLLRRSDQPGDVFKDYLSEGGYVLSKDLVLKFIPVSQTSRFLTLINSVSMFPVSPMPFKPSAISLVLIPQLLAILPKHLLWIFIWHSEHSISCFQKP